MDETNEANEANEAGKTSGSMSGHEQLPADGHGPGLYVVATPIGNLADITLRALDVLRAADVIYAEDTRTSAPLFARHGVHARLRALHEHNEARAAQEVLQALQEGKRVALVSDAGTPAISDPGARVVAQAHAAGHRVVPLPGPNAAVTALSASGFDGPFLFLGFAPAKAAARRRLFETWRDFPHVLVLHEAPHRVRECVADLLATCGATRTLVIARELTKLYESIHVGPLGEALDWLDADANRVRGEFVLLLSGAPQGDDAALREGERVLQLLLEHLPLKIAARLAADISGARKNELYERALAAKRSTVTAADDGGEA